MGESPNTAKEKLADAARTLRVYRLAVDEWIDGHPKEADSFRGFISAWRELGEEGARVSAAVLLRIIKTEFPTFPDIRGGAFLKWLRREDGGEE